MVSTIQAIPMRDTDIKNSYIKMALPLYIEKTYVLVDIYEKGLYVNICFIEKTKLLLGRHLRRYADMIEFIIVAALSTSTLIHLHPGIECKVKSCIKSIQRWPRASRKHRKISERIQKRQKAPQTPKVSPLFCQVTPSAAAAAVAMTQPCRSYAVVEAVAENNILGHHY